MTTLPRLTIAGSVPANIASYNIFTCPDATNPDTPCEFSTSQLTEDTSQLTSPPAGSILLYAHGVVGYAAFAIVCAVIVPLLACCFCICRCHLTCALCGGKGGCSWCGYGVPSRRKPDACCACGFVELQDPLGKDSVGKLQDNPTHPSGPSPAVTHPPTAAAVAAAPPAEGPRFHYTAAGRWIPRVCLLVSFLCIVVFGVMQYALGAGSVAASLKLVASAADSISPIGQGLYSATTDLIIDTSVDVLKPFVTNVNHTVHLESNPNIIIDSILCVAKGVGETSSALKLISSNLTAVQTSLDNISTTLDSVNASMQSVSTSLDGVAGLKNGQLRANIVALQTIQTDAPPTLDRAEAAMTSIEASLNNFTSPTTGLPAVSTRLTWYNNRPTPSEANASSTDMELMAQGSMSGNGKASERTQAIGRLDTLSGKAANLTGVGSLVTLLRGINRDLDTFRTQNKTEAVLAAINDTEALVATAPDINRTMVLVNDTTSLVDRLLAGVSGIRGHLLTLQSVTQSLDLDFIDSAGALFDTADTILACAARMQPHIDGLGRTVMKLPDLLASVTDQLESVNNTISSARGSFDDVSGQTDTLKNQTQNFDFNQYLAVIDSVADTDVGSFSSFGSDSNGLGGALTSVNLTSLRSQILGVQKQIAGDGLRVNETTLARLEELSPLFTNLSTLSASSLKAARTYDAKRCTSNGQTCSVDGDCASGTCVGGYGKCINGTTGTTPSSVATTSDCTTDSDCSSGFVCSFDSQLFLAAAFSFSEYASASTPDMGNSSSSLDSLSASVSSVGDLSSTRTTLNDLRSTITGLSFNASSAILTIDSASNQAESMQSTVSNIEVQIQQVRVKLQFASLIGSTKDLLSDAASMVEAAANLVKPIVDGEAALRLFQRFWYTELAPLMESVLNRNNLNGKRDAGGLGAVLLEVARFADRVIEQGSEAANAFLSSSSSSSTLFNATKQLLPYIPAAEALGDQVAQSKGGVYYAVSLGSTVGNATGLFTMPIRAAEPSGALSTVFTDGSGSKYPEGHYCVSSDCLATTIDVLVTSDLTQAQAQVNHILSPSSGDDSSGGGSTAVAIPLSLEIGLVTPLVLPLLVALFGLIPVCCCCRCKCQPVCVRCLTCCHQVVSCACASCLFLFFGVLFFPLIMVLADGCRSAPNIGFVYVDQSEAFLCKFLSGSLTQPGQCDVRVEGVAGAAATDVSLNIPRLYAALLGQDGCDNVERAEVVNTFVALSSVAGSILDSQVNATLLPLVNGLGYPLRPPMVSVMRNATSAITGTTRNLLANVGSKALSCDNLNQAAAGLYDGLCCGFTNPLYWFASTYYLMAFAFCICGWGGAMLGYKRLPNELWGPHYKEAMEMSTDRREARLQERSRARSSMVQEAEGHLASRSTKVAPAVSAAATRAVDGEDFAFETPIGAKKPLMKKKSGRGAGASSAKVARGGRGVL